MRKNFKFVILPLAFAVFACAAPAQAATVEEIESTYQEIADLQADFVQSTYVAVLEKTIKEPGVFYMKKPGLLRIEYTGEHPKIYVSNGKKLSIIDPELNQIETYKTSSIPKEGLEFLNGFGRMKKLFDVTVLGDSRLKLVPKSAGAQYERLDCEFGPDNLIKTMTIHNKSGNVSTYQFRNIKINSGLDGGLFK